MNAVPSPVMDTQDEAQERIVDLLLQRGKVKEGDLARARRLQEQDGGDLLVLLGTESGTLVLDVRYTRRTH